MMSISKLLILLPSNGQQKLTTFPGVFASLISEIENFFSIKQLKLIQHKTLEVFGLFKGS